ncbi:hypothetical protein STRAU_1268 [Streptomyces aurantiacus JA 4570]|uniref:Uncharacterized protein n=1 Tax=Streptomyces aurantiacus JA 4570 TaxID=1286094 RepID=S4AW57_9ACTN|nr:hypothetical protein STRAU_1268 [Streptomyces aurantiacus JA 4570]
MIRRSRHGSHPRDEFRCSQGRCCSIVDVSHRQMPCKQTCLSP